MAMAVATHPSMTHRQLLASQQQQRQPCKLIPRSQAIAPMLQTVLKAPTRCILLLVFVRCPCTRHSRCKCKCLLCNLHLICCNRACKKQCCNACSTMPHQRSACLRSARSFGLFHRRVRPSTLKSCSSTPASCWPTQNSTTRETFCKNLLACCGYEQ